MEGKQYPDSRGRAGLQEEKRTSTAAAAAVWTAYSPPPSAASLRDLSSGTAQQQRVSKQDQGGCCDWQLSGPIIVQRGEPFLAESQLEGETQ